MITTVTLNPAIDRTIVVNHYKMDEVNRVNQSFEDVGGKGINVSKVLRLFHGKTIATGFLGGNHGKMIRRYLNEFGIEEDFVDTSVNTRMNTKVIDQHRGTTTEFNEKGLPVKKSDIEQLKSKIEYYGKQSDFVVFSGSAPGDFDLGLYQEMIETANQYTKVAIDADGEMLKKGVRASPFLIKPNIHELRNTFDIKTESMEELIHEVRQLMEEYQVQIVLVSMGKDGSVLISAEEVLRALPIEIQVKSTVGAGDSLLGGFLYRYEQDENIVEALRYGAASGTAAVKTEGTKIFTGEQFDDILRQTEIINLK